MIYKKKPLTANKHLCYFKIVNTSGSPDVLVRATKSESYSGIRMKILSSDAPSFLRINQASERSGISRSRIYLLMAAGLIRAKKDGNNTLVDWLSVLGSGPIKGIPTRVVL